MAVIKLVEDYAVNQLRKDVRDSLMMAGEQAVLLQLFHPGDADAVPCPQCGDDVYKSPEAECDTCFGTMWQGGVRVARKVWTLFTDKPAPEVIGPRGAFQPDQRSVQFEAFPLVVEHDLLVRIRRWGGDGTPAELEGFYLLTIPQRRSLRTGNRFGQYSWDVVAQKAQLAEVPSSVHMVTRYPILGQHFEELSTVTSGVTYPSTVVQPDTKVVFFPFEPVPGEGRFLTTIGDGVSHTLVVTHQLATRDVVVQLYLSTTGEQVDADIFTDTDNTVRLVFATPPPVNALRVVIVK